MAGRYKPWSGPADVELGTLIAWDTVVGRSAHAVVVLREVRAFSDGVLLGFLTQTRGIEEEELGAIFEESGPVYPGRERFSPRYLRIYVELSDGTRASNLVDDYYGKEPPSAPALARVHPGGGHASFGIATMRSSFWLWPLPPPGRLELACEWPALGIDRSSVELDASAILAAAAESIRLWPEA